MTPQQASPSQRQASPKQQHLHYCNHLQNNKSTRHHLHLQHNISILLFSSFLFHLQTQNRNHREREWERDREMKTEEHDLHLLDFICVGRWQGSRERRRWRRNPKPKNQICGLIGWNQKPENKICILLGGEAVVHRFEDGKFPPIWGGTIITQIYYND